MFINIDNTKIHYIVRGKGQPLIFLHGIFLDTGAYKELFEILSRNFTVYGIDLPAHGKSGDFKGSASIEQYSDLIEKFVSELKIKNPVIFGYSAGGLIAILYASRNKVKHLILGDSAGVIHSSSIFFILLRLIFLMIPFGFFWNPFKLLKVSFNGISNFFRNIFTKKFFVLSSDVLNSDFSEYLKKIKCPTTIFWAKYDEVIPFKYSEIFQKNIKNSKLIKITGNHMWPILRPKEILKHIKIIS
ncbi:alpha/beta hydrolase [Candidatus Woesearchaeota archaeon]|nr:alpha/beta hydrolase [Candidatus Woesearchaeota archaeon]